MGLRSFVALPVEKGGVVIRLSAVNTNSTTSLITSAAYGVGINQTLLLGVPFKLSSSSLDDGRLGNVSALYRYIVWRKDSLRGTDRFGLLGGTIIPTGNDIDPATQAGFVFTHFKNRHEIDIDVLYQSGMKERLDSGRYDMSWQYRLIPAEHLDWGISQEINTVIELNGRWTENSNITHQVTIGLQSIHQELVIEGGFVRDLNNRKENLILLGIRFHF